MPTAPSQLAREAAQRRLAEAHADEWARLLAEERVARGLTPEVVRGMAAVPRTPAPAVCRVVASAKVADQLGITTTTWRTWVTRGIPVGREADVAAALGLPLEVLWPQPKPAEEPKPKRTRTVPDPSPFACDGCTDTFMTRADLARHRLHTGHSHDDEAAS